MNTILLQKILDILTEGLAHIGNFFKDLFVSDPQDGQIIIYDAESGHWVNMDATEVELDLTNTFEAQALATITDGAENVPMKSLIVDIVPKQASGTPTPSSPLPITGFTGANITHTGINQWDEQWESGAYNSSGEKVEDNTQIRAKNFCPCLPNTNYYKKVPASGRVCWYDANKTFISRTSSAVDYAVTSPENARYFTLYCAVSTYNNDISINYPSTDTSYHAYTATIIPSYNNYIPLNNNVLRNFRKFSPIFLCYSTKVS